MLWQDWVLSAANIVFFVSLLPQVYQGFREKKGFVSLSTAGPTFICLYAMAITFFTLSLRFASIIAFSTGVLWMLIFIQGLLYRKA